ncbi:MAG TPA: hypothetical protein DIS73_07165 [Planctomycetia bacterium]|nr:hypothetical protein [Planctomycetia bacterium]
MEVVILSEAKNLDCVAWQLAATIDVGASSNATSSVATLPQNGPPQVEAEFFRGLKIIDWTIILGRVCVGLQ